MPPRFEEKTRHEQVSKQETSKKWQSKQAKRKTEKCVSKIAVEVGMLYDARK